MKTEQWMASSWTMDSLEASFPKHPTSKSAWTTSKAPALAALASSGFWTVLWSETSILTNCGRFIDGKFINSGVFTTCVSSFVWDLLDLGIAIEAHQEKCCNLAGWYLNQKNPTLKWGRKIINGPLAQKIIQPPMAGWLQYTETKCSNPWSIWYPKNCKPSLEYFANLCQSAGDSLTVPHCLLWKTWLP